MVERYFVTCMEKNGSTKEAGWPDFGLEYSYGFYSEKEEALEEINKDARSVYQNIYKYILIEKMGTGIHPDCFEDSRWWFCYNDKENMYESVDEVNGLCYCNYALG